MDPGVFQVERTKNENQNWTFGFQIYYSTGTAATLMCVVFYNNEVYFSSGELIWGIVGASEDENASISR